MRVCVCAGVCACVRGSVRKCSFPYAIRLDIEDFGPFLGWSPCGAILSCITRRRVSCSGRGSDLPEPGGWGGGGAALTVP